MKGIGFNGFKHASVSQQVALVVHCWQEVQLELAAKEEGGKQALGEWGEQ